MPRLLRAGAGLLAWACAAGAAEYRFDFSSTTLDEQPAGFRSAVTGEGGPGAWKVVLGEFPSQLDVGSKVTLNDRRKVLAQTSQNPADNRFPILIYEGDVYQDFKMQTRFKAVAGQVEQMAGIAFRIQDEKNYFVLRVSVLGNNVAFYPVKDGKISSPPVRVPVEIDHNAWHLLAVECQGTKILCSLDGKQVLPDLQDPTFAKGRVGFWTKSDAVTQFADAFISYVPRERFAEILVRDMKVKYPHMLGLKISANAGPTRDHFQIVASTTPSEVGRDADPLEKDVMTRAMVYFGKGDDKITVAMPLHDRNGDVVASVRVLMKTFPGQTEVNAIARAMPITKAMEARLLSERNLLE